MLVLNLKPVVFNLMYSKVQIRLSYQAHMVNTLLNKNVCKYLLKSCSFFSISRNFKILINPQVSVERTLESTFLICAYVYFCV